ncbi:GerAB/ArcD/ProY family transporter [Halonatronum saccharophilum]|uniref:GerAB/ArcD/ProY family transporter n=1 Tax=Halonatronum saccharophilum TaxID=150060 RepID=UPI0004855C4A|nr:endospore germination permease [Halonatronum saccharophilum]
MKKIGNIELFCLVFIFTIGNVGLYALGVDVAEQDAWIAMLVAMVVSYGLLWIYIKLQSCFPQDNLADIIIKLLGKVVGIPLICLYCLYFLYITLLNISLHIEFVQLFLIPRTPVIMIYILAMINVLYIIFSGIEVISRVAIFSAISFVLFIIIIYTMVFASGVVNITNIQPILGRGLGPVLDAAIPDLMIFPFADMVMFLTIWRYVNDKRAIFKLSIAGMTLGGIIISLSLFIMVATLGVRLSNILTYANMKVSDVIDIGVINNVDIIVVTFLLTSGFFKVVLFLYGAISLLECGFKINNKVGIIFPLTILLAILIYVPFFGGLFHHWIMHLPQDITEIIKYVHVSFQMIIPTLLLMIAWVKSSYKS